MRPHRTRGGRVLCMFAALGIPVGLAACDGDDLSAGREASASRDNTLRIVQRDLAFEVEGEVAAGDVTIDVDNQGDQLHQLVMIRLREDKTIEDVRGALAQAGDDEDPLADLAAELDGPIDDLGGVQFPGTRYAVTGSGIPAGDYAVVCFIPDQDGQPHAQHGMVAGFTVAEGNVDADPAADATLTVTDDGLDGPSSLPAGRIRLAVANESSSSREVGIARLAEGKDLDDVVEFFEETGEDLPDVAASPFAFFGLVYDAEQDRVLTLDLEPGTWAISMQDPANPSDEHPGEDPFTLVIEVE